VSVVIDFFRAMPEVMRAAWDFGEGFYGATVTVGSLVLLVLFCMLAFRLRDEHSWLSATFGAMATTIGMWWGFGILPSAWMYFLDGARDLLEGVVIPEALPGMDNFYAVFRDSVVMGMMFVGVGVLVLVALRVQKRFPRSLAEGEESRPQSGGYK
jgi:high-affinity Fe2+/Pb2+ permease